MSSLPCKTLLITMLLAASPLAIGQRNINFELLGAARSGSEASVLALLDQGANPDSPFELES